MRGLSSRMSGIFRLMVMIASCSSRGRCRRPAPSGPPPAAEIFQLRIWGPSEALAKPSSDPDEISACAGHELPLTPRLEMFEMRRLRINEETCRHGERWALGRGRHAGDAEGPSDAHRPAENS